MGLDTGWYKYHFFKNRKWLGDMESNSKVEKDWVHTHLKDHYKYDVTLLDDLSTASVS